MSVDRSLKRGDALSRHRNVLTRAERIEALAEEDKWNEQTDSVFSLPKVAHRKSHAGRKDAKKQADAEETPGEATEAATPGEAAEKKE